MKKKTPRRRIEVDIDELDRIIDTAMRGPLNEAEGRTLRAAVHAMAERLVRRRNTEKTSAVLEPKTSPAAVDTPPEPEKPSSAGHGRNRADAFTGADKVAIAHSRLHSGDSCPACEEGKVYRQKEPATLIRIIGQAPLQATVYEMERLRCNACGEVFTANPPQSAGPEKFDATAVAMIALLKYGTGMPFNRMERLEGQLGIPLPATTQWELMEAAAKWLKRILSEFIRQAAQGGVVHNDNTGMRILQMVRRGDDGRTGTFTSGIVSISGGWKTALYFSGWKLSATSVNWRLPCARQLPSRVSISFGEFRDNASHIWIGGASPGSRCFRTSARFSPACLIHTEQSQPVRLPDRTAPASRGSDRASIRVDAVELQGRSSRRGRVISRMATWPERILMWPWQ